jgi:hypothetical protein
VEPLLFEALGFDRQLGKFRLEVGFPRGQTTLGVVGLAGRLFEQAEAFLSRSEFLA